MVVRVLKGALAASLLSSALFGVEVNVYSHRHYEADKALFAEFEKSSGIKVNVVTAKAEELVKKLEMEGENSKADILITADVGNLYQAKSAGLLQKIESKTLNESIPEHLRDSDGEWYGLTKRARVIVYNKSKIDPKELSTYEALTDEKWKGKLLIRSSSNIYNQSMLASFIARMGEEKSLEWAKGVVANMAREPKGGDRDQAIAVHQGVGDIAVMNTYYLGILAASKDEKDREVASSVGVFFPNQGSSGTHINISGAGITKAAKNKKEAIALLEFLISPKAQSVFAEANHEYPINKSVKPSGVVATWGEFKEDMQSLNNLGKYNKEAVKLFDKAGWR